MTKNRLSLQRLAARTVSARNSSLLLLVSAALFSPGDPAYAQPQRVLGLDASWHNRGTCAANGAGITQTMWNTAYNTPNANGYTRHFAWIRATRGGTTGLSEGSGSPCPHGGQETLSRRYDDPEFLRSMTRSTAAGFFSGPYHFGRPDIAGNTGTDEADHFIEYASAYMRPGYLMPVYDLEAGSGSDASAQFAIDFSNRLYERMRIRPAIYINGAYSSVLEGATVAREDQLAKPSAYTPSMVGPAYPMVWNARYSDNNNPEAIPIQTGSPKFTYSSSSGYYGPWDNYGDSEPWAFWQYASTVTIPGMIDTGMDGNVSHGDLEYVKNYLVPAVWWHDSSGEWSTLANWNSGQPLSTFNPNNLNSPPAPYSPRWGSGQTTPFASYTLPTPRLPGAAGSGSTSGQHDTVILERPNAIITVTLSSGSYNIRKLYVREALNITGGSLSINYDPTYRPDTSALVRHGGPVSAQFSGPVTLSGGLLNVHTLQVDLARNFTLSGGTLTFNNIDLMPHSTTPAKIIVNGNVTFNPAANAMAVIEKGSGSGTSGFIDLAGGSRIFTVGNGTNDVDLSIDVPISNGALGKGGAGTLRLTLGNSYAGGTIVSSGRLLVNNPTGSGTGTGIVSVNGGTLGGIGRIGGTVTVSTAGTIAPGTSIGTLTLTAGPNLGGTTLMEIDRNGGIPLSDKLVVTSGTLSYGGTLVVANVGSTLVGGETFSLFQANAFSGSFANVNLPTLNAGLNWYLGHLTTNGTIKVNRKPTVNSFAVTNNFPGVLQIPIASLTANGADADGDSLSLSNVGVSTNGVTLSNDGTHLVYSNAVNVPDKFDFVVTDNRGGFATNTVSIAPAVIGEFAEHPNANGGSISLNFSGTPGVTYYLDRATNLPPSWLTIWTNVAPSNGMFDYTDEFDDLSEPPPSAFYRLRW